MLVWDSLKWRRGRRAALPRGDAQPFFPAGKKDTTADSERLQEAPPYPGYVP